MRELLANHMLLAPLTKGGNLPFRRLCADFGCEIALGEMVFARQLIGGSPLERARIRRAPNEKVFGVQIATNDAEEGRRAVRLAADAGADFVDLNCGCPIHEATRRGLGSAMLRKPERLASLVHDIALDSPLPLTVKIRTAAAGRSINAREVVRLVREAGASAVTIHGRTSEQRYSRAADWALIGQIVAENAAAGGASRMPIIGNGDVLTHYEAERLMRTSGVDALMIGRAALTQPWSFQNFYSRSEWQPDAFERVSIYRRLACYQKEHFGDDERGRQKAFNFLPWHFDFFTRYRPLPEADFASASERHPLMLTRFNIPDDATPLERVLSRSSDAPLHERIASVLWESSTDAEAVRELSALGEGLDPSLASEAAEVIELSNVPSASDGGKGVRRRRRRVRPPPRTEAEIAALRAARSAKREASGALPHVDGRAELAA